VTKKPKKPKKPKKDKEVAWTQIKQDVLKDLIRERITVEQTPKLSEEWLLSRTLLQILNIYLSDAIKQNILNDLIDDKIAYLQNVQTINTDENISLQTTIDQGLSLKE